MPDVVHNPDPGRWIHLVRWSRGRDGCWSHEVHRGLYVRYDPDVWVVEVGGTEHEFPRNIWNRYTPDPNQPR